MSRRMDDLVRNRFGDDALECRADDDGDGTTLFGHFSVFDRWYEIDSWFEGRFLERTVPGAFVDVFKNKSRTKVLFQHGRDPQIGQKPLGSPDVLREDDTGPYYESRLLDTSYNADLIPALREGLYGASFRFSVAEDEWVEPKRATKRNPDQIPERTITRIGSLPDVGPVTYGANPDATAGMRSGTDSFIDQLLDDPLFLARFVDRVGLDHVEQLLADVPDSDRTSALEPVAVHQDPTGITHAERSRVLGTLILT